LVDTSVWIRFLAGQEPYASALDELLAQADVVSHDLVQGELLIGDRGRARAKLLAAYATIRRVRTVPHAEVVEFVTVRRLQGTGLGWIDAHLLAAAAVERCTVWSADVRLQAAATSLHLAHSPTS
jgi:predicted nucleic acid-binding protein